MPRKPKVNGEWRDYGAGRIQYRVGTRGITFKALIYLGLKPDGTQNRPTKNFPTEGDAEAWIDLMASDSRRGALTEDRTRRTGAVLASWLAERTGRVNPRTLLEYTQINARFERMTGFTGRPILELKPLHIQHALSEIAASSSPAYANRCLRQLQRVLTFAQERDWVVKNTGKQVKPFNTDTRVEVDAASGNEAQAVTSEHFWEPSEASKFLQVAQGYRAPKNPDSPYTMPFYAMYVLMLAHGFRVGEMMALTWEQVDLTPGTEQVRIRTSYDPNTKTLGPPKRGSRRTIRIGEESIAALTAHQAAQVTRKAVAGEKWQEQGAVFTTGVGTRTDYSNIHRLTDRLIKLAGVRRITVHDMRHTAATAMIRYGLDVALVAKMLGHADPNTTLKRYVHVWEERRPGPVPSLRAMYGTHEPAPANALT